MRESSLCLASATTATDILVHSCQSYEIRAIASKPHHSPDMLNVARQNCVIEISRAECVWDCHNRQSGLLNYILKGISVCRIIRLCYREWFVIEMRLSWFLSPIPRHIDQRFDIVTK